MFLPTPDDMKKMRLELNLTQNELACRAGVSQPLIARIEAGDVDPRLSTVGKILNAFDAAKKERITVKNIMSTPIIHTTSETSIEDAVRIMEKYGFSQMPVIDEGILVGSLSSDHIVSLMTDQDIKKLSHLSVKNIMSEAFPTISSQADSNTVSRILEKNPAVIVTEKGKVIGVVTKHDVMKMLKG